MSQKPLVSVIVPVYKVEAYLHRCVDSILNQSYSDLELILVDDGSPDRCGEICDAYAAQDSRVHVIHQENGGLSAARNAGMDWMMAHSDAQWLTFVDSDDWVHRDYLKILMDMAVQSGTSVAMCDYVRRSTYMLDESVELSKVEICSFRRMYCEYYSMCMTACCKIYRRSLWKTLRFPIGKLHEDAYITHIPLLEAGKVSLCTLPLYFYYTNVQSITRTVWSPRRMDQIEAHEMRLSEWKSRDYNDCYIRELQVYVEALIAQLQQLQAIGSGEYAIHQKGLQKKLRTALREARRSGRYPFTEEYWGEYTLAYPRKLYRRLIYILLKVTKI